MKRAALIFAAVLLASLATLHAQLGLPRDAYGVWDRGGNNTVAAYPVTRGQEYAEVWANVNKAIHTFDWSGLDAQLQFADTQNEKFIIQILPIGLSAGNSIPLWMFSPNFPSYTDGVYTYGYYLNPTYKQYYAEMVQALANHVRHELAANLQARVAFVRVDTGATGDEVPYQVVSKIPAQYQIADPDWQAFRRWAFEVYRAAFQDGPGSVIPMLYQDVDILAYPDAWNWAVANVKGGFGVKFGGQCRGHQLSSSNDVPNTFKAFTVNPAGMQLFSRNEMDNTFQQPYFQLNVRLGMYWAAVEQLNAGMSVWDVNQGCLQDSSIHSYTSTFEFFNQWAAEVIPATAGGGFCILHEGLDSSDTKKFPVASYGNYPANQGSTQRYTAICNAYSAQGAKMDDLNGATMGSVAQRGNSPGLIGFNDAGWGIIPGNYERFITQLNPDTTSKGVWRINGPLSTSSHPYDRFARRTDHASAKDTMSFDINDKLLPTLGQRVQLNVTYLDRGTGQFSLKYDAVGNNQKTAFTVTKTGSNAWITRSIEVADWVFVNHGPNGSDLQLVNLANDTANPDTIFHGVEVIKLADFSVGTVGKGTVTGRNNAAAYAAIPNSVMEGQRLELTATPAPGWVFTGWSGALTGTTPHPFLFPTKDTRLTATFSPASVSSSLDDFNTGTLTGGSGWSGDWTTSGSLTLGLIPQLSAGASITRTLATPLTGATLTFDWDLDRIATSESGKVEVYNGSFWITVWTQNDKGLDDSNNPNLVTSGRIGLSGTISQIRFTLNATGGGFFYIDNVSLTGTPNVAPNSAPLFSTDPIGKATAIVGSAYAGTLSGGASDPNSIPLTFSKLSGGPAWLSVASNGTLSGTPSLIDVGLNSWNVQVTSFGGSDTALLLIYVSATGANPPSALRYSSNTAVYTKGTSIAINTPTSIGGSVVQYVVSPALPAGLTINNTTGVISGTPTDVSPATIYTVTATNADGFTTSSISIAINDTTARLANLSARVAVGGVAGTPIPGFVLSGVGNKQILIRGVGPTLGGFGVSGALADPQFTLFSGATILSGNDNWLAADAAAMAATGAFALGANSKDAALLNSLPAGAYTAPVTAADGVSGVALLEVYEASSSATPVLINGSTRAYVGTGASVLIPGFVVGGSGNLRLLIRAVGPTLAAFGVTGALADPMMTLFSGSTAVATNDNWSNASNAAEIASIAQAVGAFELPNGSRDAAILTTLPPGAYTVVVSGVGATSGTALVELYVVP